MPATFLVSDTHFSHAGVCRFLKADNVTKLRPWDNPDEMDEAMVKAWNDRVGPKDKVYHLGDVVINRRALAIMRRLNGDKVLIKGNHDIFHIKDYLEHFRDVRAYHVLNGLVLSHMPVHESQMYRFGTNIHGHMHDRRVIQKVGDEEVLDVRYHSVCVEQLPDHAPMLFEDVLKRIKEEGGTVGFRDGNGPTL